MSEIDPELEAGYNLRARHPEREAVYADMARRSAALRASAPVRLDLRYGPSPPETLDYFPAARGARLFVFVHGGYWRALDKAIFSFLAKPFLDAGIAVALTNYGLAPSVPLAEIVAQSDRSIAWLARNAGELGHDPARIVVCGHSAGGHLAAMAALADWPALGLARPPIAAIVPVSGLFDLAPLVRTNVNEALRLTPAAAMALSPTSLLRATGIPTLVAVGGRETKAFRAQSRDFHAAWQEAGNPSAYLEPASHTHFTVLEDIADPGAGLCRAILALLQ